MQGQILGRTSGPKFIWDTKTLERGGAQGPPPDLRAEVTLRQQRAPVGYREQERPRHPSRLQSCRGEHRTRGLASWQGVGGPTFSVSTGLR